MLRRLVVPILAMCVLATLPAPVRALTIERVRSPGGVEAWLIQDRSAPIVALHAGFAGGSAQDPSGKEGVANMLASMLDEGAGPYDSQAFQGRLESLSIEFSAEADRDRFYVGIRTLADRREEAVDMLALALAEPRFDGDALERVRGSILASIQRDQENPQSIAWRTLWQALFPDHVYGRLVRGTAESVKALTRADLVAFHRARLVREGLVIGVVGHITPEDLKPLLDRAFGRLPAKGSSDGVPEAKPDAPGTTTVIRRPIPQSVVAFGHFGIKRDDPDFYAAYVVNYILGGGGFNSRLMEQVREKRGLAYSVTSYLSTLRHAGLVMGSVGTENAQAAKSLELIRAEWRRMREEGPSERELANAKTYLTGSFALQLSSTGRIARMLVSIQAENLGIDYLDKRNSYIEKVTIEDARRAARRLYDPDRLTVVVVGDPADLASTN
jgi:zinc protease